MIKNFQAPRGATLNHFIKPLTEANNLLAGAVGSRPIASYVGVKSGDPLAAYTLPDFTIQPRPTTAQIDAGSVAPFGNPTVSKSTWTLNDYMVFSRVHSEILSDDVLNNTENTDNSPNAVGDQILRSLASRYGASILKDSLNTAFWSHTDFDPATDYTATHEFPAKTISSYQKDDGFMAKLADANVAGAFTNYKTTSATGGIDVDGATLSTSNANALAQQLLNNAPRKLRSYKLGMPQSERPFLLLSNDFYYVLRRYVATTFTGVDAGYLLFADGADGRRSEIGFSYEGFAVYNGHAVLDEYWETTNPASQFNHMGIFTCPENLSIAFNVGSPRVAAGEEGLRLYQRPEPEMGGAVDMSLYLQMDFLIADTSLFSTVGLEQAPQPA